MATALVPFLIGTMVVFVSATMAILYPKGERFGENRIVVVTTIIMLLISCYLLYTIYTDSRWAFAYLAQLHPFELPEYLPPMHDEKV